MLTWRWIISHICNWITVYVYCYNAHIRFHTNQLVMRLLFVNCPAVICLPNMLIIFYKETPLVNCASRFNSFTLIKPPTAIIAIFHTIYLILCIQLRPGGDLVALSGAHTIGRVIYPFFDNWANDGDALGNRLTANCRCNRNLL